MQINLAKQFHRWSRRTTSRRLIQFLVISLILVAGAVSSIDWINTPTIIKGRADVRDGDSLVVGRYRVRLVGIDAPERDQSCERHGRSWPCGRAAARHLSGLIGSRTVECAADKRDRFQRLLARCRAGDRELNRSMVRDGMAVSFGRRYMREEAAARNNKRGLWAGRFQRPKLWRQQNQTR